MIEAVIRALIGIAILVLCAYLIIWVLAALGIALPAMVVKVLWIIVALIAVLYIVRLLRPHTPGTWL